MVSVNEINLTMETAKKIAEKLSDIIISERILIWLDRKRQESPVQFEITSVDSNITQTNTNEYSFLVINAGNHSDGKPFNQRFVVSVKDISREDER